MTPHFADDHVNLWHGDCLDVLAGLPDGSVDAVVTDPPYGLSNTDPKHVEDTITKWINGERDYLPKISGGFMGKAWDAFVPPVAVWDECLRILKPGGHLLAFAGSRTFDLMTLAVRLAGFEVRDSIAWLYGNGFPKSMNVTDAMERWKAGEPQDESAPKVAHPDVYKITAHLRRARNNAGWTNQQIDGLFGTNGMAGHWTTQASQPAVPSVAQWERLKQALGFGDELDDLVRQIGATERDQREPTTDADAPRFLQTLRKNVEYESAGGWGTALKPAFEPIVVARKRIRGTVAANIAQYGSGALNIDGCRIGTEGGHRDLGVESRRPASVSAYGDGLNGRSSAPVAGMGRWPANVILDESQAAALDEQTGVTVSRAGKPRASTEHGDGWGMTATGAEYDDLGGASRFFYTAKADAAERITHNGIAHPTVKPLDLMRWLVRLVTPPGGTILEPFAGSGTTVEAALLEGFHCIAIEREADYLPLITQRINRRRDPIAYLTEAGDDLGLFGEEAS